MKDRGDLLGDDLLPRKNRAQGSVPAPSITLPSPEPTPPAPAPLAAAPAREKELVAMTFRLPPPDWMRLKQLTMQTRKSAQSLLHEALDRLLKENGL